MKILTIILVVAFSIGLGYILGASGKGGDRQGSAGAIFQDATKHTYGDVLSSLLRWGEEPGREKKYEEVVTVELPEMATGSLGVEDAISMRRSVRDFSGLSMPGTYLSRLLYSSSGVTRKDDSSSYRAAPSAGALYPIETYVVVYNVEGIEPGIYHYSPSEHHLELLREGDFRNRFTAAALYQDMGGRCNALFILTAVFKRVTWKYGDRGYRYAYMEAGSISENIYLQAVSLGLGSVMIGAFFDDKVSDLIGIDGVHEAPLLLHAVGE